MKKSTKIKAGVTCGVAAAAVASAYAGKKIADRGRNQFVTTDGEKINSSESLTRELEEEIGHEMKRINSMGGTFGTFSRRDKSWKNTGDFFGQLFSGRKK